MGKDSQVQIRVSGTLKQAIKNICDRRRGPNGKVPTITAVFLNALYTKNPEIYKEMKRLELLEENHDER